MTWERALEADARLAAKNAVLIRAALRQSVNFENLFTGYMATSPNENLPLPQQRARARSWAMINIRVNLEPLKQVLLKAYAEAFVLGEAAAGEAIEAAKQTQKAETKTTINWDKWKPGDAATGLWVRRPGLLRFIFQYTLPEDVILRGISEATLNDIGNALGEAIELGLDAKGAAKLIQNHVASPARALTIAITEQNRAISFATRQRYINAGLQEMEWLVFEPCNICAQNANVVRRINTPFPSGDIQPPAHPNCRCALAPVIPGMEEEAIIPGGQSLNIEEQPEALPTPTASVTGQFAPGAWRELDRDTIRETVIEDYVRAFPSRTRDEIIRYIDSGRISAADISLLKKGIILENGPISVQFMSAGLKVPQKSRKKLLDAIEKLQTTAPKDRMVVIVASERGDAYGSAILGDAKIWMKPSVVMDESPMKAELGFKMPVIATVPHREYTLTHEWGHTLDTGGSFTKTKSVQNPATEMFIEELQKQYSDAPENIISRYAKKNTREFYAEMYAEWYLTEGNTTNPVVQAMARNLGWQKPTAKKGEK